MPRSSFRVRRLIGLLAASAIGLFGAFLITSPASAHTASVTGKAACQHDGTYTVTWTLSNDWRTPLSVVQLKGTPVPPQHNVGTVEAHGSANATQIGVPGTAKQATLSFKAVWTADNYRAKASGSVQLAGDCTSAPSCVSAADAHYSHTFNGANGTATVTLNKGQQLCADSSQDFSLASYTAQGPEWNSSLPQKLAGQDSGTIDAQHPSATLKVTVPDCFAQVDLIWGGKDQVLPGFDEDSPTYGNAVLGSTGAPGNKSVGPRGVWHGGSTACTVPSSPTVSPTPSASPSHSSAAPASSSPASGQAAGNGGLPVTGTSLTAFVIAAVVLIGGGTALFVVARKRRSAATGQ